MCGGARQRAMAAKIEFTISVEDIVIPEVCPIYGMSLEFHKKHPQNNSYSLDRVDNSKGYVPGNVRVISRLANSVKGNLSLDLLKRYYLYSIGEL